MQFLCMDRTGRQIGEEEEMKKSAAAESGGATTTEDVRMVSGRKRKFYSDAGDFEAAENRRSPAEERTFDFSDCEADESAAIAEKRDREPDLADIDSSSEDCELGAEASTSVNVFFSGEATPYSDISGGKSERMMVFQTPYPSRKPRHLPPEAPTHKLPVHVADLMPSASELEDFFTAAEMYEKKRFAEKYNYDVVMDIPLEGRYKWVRLQP